MNFSLVKLMTEDDLDDKLQWMNENGMMPDLPFVDAHGTANIAHGMSPSGDDWVIGYEAPRDPDSGVPHCCDCEGHLPAGCEAGAMWTPTFPILVLMSEDLPSPPDGWRVRDVR